ncbi:MAG: hypothetical protein HUJ27_05000 [Rhodobacteraceae bacterium]|nr:hypothetical protein [Paracoccaceae bacterium]
MAKPILRDPTTERYIQADPLGLVDGASVYGYALQSPLRYVDPRGEQTSNLPAGGRPTIKFPSCGCELHHAIPKEYVPIVTGRKRRPGQTTTPMETPHHRAFHADLIDG